MWGRCIFLLFLIRVVFAYDFGDVVSVLRQNGIDPGCVYFNPNYQDICTCGGMRRPVSLEPSSSPVNENLLIVYDKANLQDCDRGKVYGAYRVLLNQSDVNGALCQRGDFSRDVTDCRVYGPPIGIPPIPPPIPPPPFPYPDPRCPEQCVDMIRRIPRGPPGPPGGNSLAPSRRERVERTFYDLKQAFKKYTGCSIGRTDYTKQWHYQPSNPSFCYKYTKPVTYIRDTSDDSAIRSGYIVLTHTVQPVEWVRPFMSLVYRSVENDIIPAMCQNDMFPFFVTPMRPRFEEIECSADVN